MGLRCLIGHDYGEPRTTREREERGDEVVVTVREYRECSRCGERRVLSENKEVRADDEAGAEATADPAPGGDYGGNRTDVDRAEATGEFDDVSAEEDDGVILEDDEPSGEGRQYGQWPDADDADGDDAGEGGDDERPEVEASGDWPRTPEADEGFSAGPAEDGPAEDVEFGAGLSPESADRSAAPDDADADVEPTAEADDDQRSPADEAEDVEFIDDAETDAAAEAADAPSEAPEPSDAAETSGGSTGESERDAPSDEAATDTGIRSAGPGPSPTGQQRLAGVDTEFVCPECDYTAPATESSLRPGDICPECGRGYLSERERE